MSAWLSAGPLIGAGPGYAASFFGDWGKDQRAAKRQDDLRRATKNDEHDRFELETLTSCGEQLKLVDELTLSIYIENLRMRVHETQKGTQFGEAGIPPNIRDGLSKANPELQRLEDLLLSASIRQKVKEARLSLGSMQAFHGSHSGASDQFHQARALIVPAQSAIAERIRYLYGGERP
ncbi:MAG: hypothetical protein QOE71_1678 [Pseudonocardiales bacterium]|nr:hypothetical protein [Pseudonocardiales bacterium]